jgi:hypothetical protein
MVVKHKESMQSSDSFLRGLSICNKRSEILALATKEIVLSWWTPKTHMNPNHKDVVKKKKLAIHSYEWKPTQYVMEMHVSFFIILCFLFVDILVSFASTSY